MRKYFRDLLSNERRARGTVFVLPGIEGYSHWNRQIVRGLADANVPYALEIYDWTWRWPFFAINMRSEWMHRRQAHLLADKIAKTQLAYPDAPIWLIGHSGGGALSLLTLSLLPQGQSIAGAVLLGAAISSQFDVRSVLPKVQRTIWNFWSSGDRWFLGLLTTCGGTFDGRFTRCVGNTGYGALELAPEHASRFEDKPFLSEYYRLWNFGGHFGYTTRPFVRECVAPLLMGEGQSQKIAKR